jgi:hypothetical protein
MQEVSFFLLEHPRKVLKDLMGISASGLLSNNEGFSPVLLAQSFRTGTEESKEKTTGRLRP